MRKTLTLLLVTILMASVAAATPMLQQKVAKLESLPMLDTFDDTIAYDDNVPQWWYGGLNNFQLATKFTPLAAFELQQTLIALTDGPLPLPADAQIWVASDNAGVPGDTLYGPVAMTFPVANTWIPLTIDTLGTYTFAAGENFWIALLSPGPPYELFDSSPVAPPRSFMKFSTSTTWAAGPGDNFIRAVGEYTSAIIDIAMDSVWHGNNFFVTNGSSFQVGCRVRNASPTNPATVDIGCHIYTEIDETTYTFFDSLAIQTRNLAPGAAANVTFPAYTWNTDDRYRIDVVAYFAGDVNPDNNQASTETQVYTPTDPSITLRYDDTSPDGSAYSSTIGMGWGMKFDPQFGGPYNVSQVHVMASGAASDSVARIRLLADDGDAPGTILWETTANMGTAGTWNDFNVNVGNTGACYLMYYFEHGASTSALTMDGYPRTGLAYEYDPIGGYIADPAADDWAMRITLGEGQPPPEFVVDLTYVSGSPVPPGGGNLYFDVYLSNNSGAAQDFDAWLASEYEGGPPSTLVLRSFTNYLAGWAINRPNTFYPVAAGWAAGNYEMYGRCGNVPNDVWAEDFFPFVKSGVSDGQPFQPYPVDGAPNPFDVIDKSGTIVTDFTLVGAYPNPFNPTTTISYAIGNDGNVTLSVYDITGREVASLVDGYRVAGVHEVAFDASELASGVYVYKLTSGNQTATAKIVLMK